jgi:hypothetical protein
MNKLCKLLPIVYVLWTPFDVNGLDLRDGTSSLLGIDSFFWCKLDLNGFMIDNIYVNTSVPALCVKLQPRRCVFLVTVLGVDDKSIVQLIFFSYRSQPYAIILEN